MNSFEEWKSIIINDEIIPNYYVSNFGRIRKWDTKKSKWFYPKLHNRIQKVSGFGAFQSVTINYKTKKPSCKTQRVHRLVAQAFMPLNDHPPIPKVDWDKTPDSVKEMIKQCIIIDHIDDNPHNNYLNNLRWCTPHENNPHNKKRSMNV
jgi:hypothetical protein